MPTEDLIRLRNLLFQQGYTIQSYELRPDGPTKAINTANEGIKFIFDSQNLVTKTTLVLKNNKDQIVFTSNERDVLLYTSTFHKTLDKDGNWAFQCYTDNENYYKTIDLLVDNDGSKRKTAYDKISKGEFRPGYNPEQLIRKFLLTGYRKNKKKFEALRTDYFEILVNQVLILKKYLEMDKKLKNERLGYAELSKSAREILEKGFQTEENQIKNFLAYHKSIDIDIEEITKKIQEEKDYHHQLFESFAQKAPYSEIKIVSKAPLDVYRRYCELSSHFINALRISIEIGKGDKNTADYKKFVTNVEILRSIPEYAVLVKTIEPRIRHSESHINTEIDEKTGIVRFTEKKGKNRKILCEYPLNEISKMILQLDRDFFPAMVITFTIFETNLFLKILDSFEYRILLIGIGNIK